MSSKWSRALGRLFGGITTNNNGYGYNNNGYNNNGGYYGAQPQALQLGLKFTDIEVFHSYISDGTIWLPTVIERTDITHTQWECIGKTQVNAKRVHRDNAPVTSIELFCVRDPKAIFDNSLLFFNKVGLMQTFNVLSGDGTQIYARDLTVEDLAAVPVHPAPQGPQLQHAMIPQPPMMMYATPGPLQHGYAAVAPQQPQQQQVYVATPPPPPTSPQWVQTISGPQAVQQAVLVPTLYPPKQV